MRVLTSRIFTFHRNTANYVRISTSTSTLLGGKITSTMKLLEFSNRTRRGRAFITYTVQGAVNKIKGLLKRYGNIT